MCLTSLGRYKISNGIGYKLFEKVNGHLTFKIRGIKKQLPIGKWLKEDDYRSKDDKEIAWIHADYRGKYKPGFHIYLNSHGEISRRKVKFRKLVARGYQSGEKVIVAKEIYIFPKVRK